MTLCRHAAMRHNYVVNSLKFKRAAMSSEDLYYHQYGKTRQLLRNN